MSWRVEAHGIGESRWSNNAMTYDTEDEAKREASSLFGRWIGCDATRVVPEDTPKRQAYKPEDALYGGA